MSQRISKVLYYADSTPITQKDIEKSLVKVGLKKGDTILVQSDIRTFGKLVTFDRKFLLQSLINSMKNVLSEEGTIIMPTFTFSFVRNETFDLKNTKSRVGTLGEYFRKQKDASRTIHPNHSVAIWGKHKNTLLNIGKGTFDESSIFGKFHTINGKCVSFGTPFRDACTFIHYIEHMHQVPYRYMKNFRGKIISNGKEYEDGFTLYYKYSFIFNSFLKIEKHLIKKGLLKQVTVGNAQISIIESKVMYNEVYELLNKDVLFLLKNDPIIFKLFNKGVCPFLRYFPWPFRILDPLFAKYFY